MRFAVQMHVKYTIGQVREKVLQQKPSNVQLGMLSPNGCDSPLDENVAASLNGEVEMRVAARAVEGRLLCVARYDV